MVRQIRLQLSFSNKSVVPESIRWVDKETIIECIKRKLRDSDGNVVFPSTEKCSLSKLPDGLATAKYELVDAFCQERINLKFFRNRNRNTYYMVRFLFVPSKLADVSKSFKNESGKIQNDFEDMCHGALWRAQVFSNLFYGDGGEITGERVVNIALVAREPLFRSDGTPVMVWQKDENGNRVGGKPAPLKAKHFLLLNEVVTDLVTA